MTIKSAAGRLHPRLLVDSHQGSQARCERDAGARTGEGLWQASEIYAPLEAWQALGQPTIAINANFFDVRGQKGGSWRDTKCSSPLGAYVDNTRGQGRANAAVTGTLAYAGKQGLSGGGENWSSLATMILPAGGAAVCRHAEGAGRLRLGVAGDPEAARPERSVSSRSPASACSLRETRASSTTAGRARRGPRSRTTGPATSCTSSRAAVIRPTRYRTCSAGWAPTTPCCWTAAARRRSCCGATPAECGAAPGFPKGSCDTQQVLCDSRERALPSWLAFA